MKVTERLSSPIISNEKILYLLNGCEDWASTLKTSHHREFNIVAPEGGRAEMGIIEVIYERDLRTEQKQR